MRSSELWIALVAGAGLATLVIWRQRGRASSPASLAGLRPPSWMLPQIRPEKVTDLLIGAATPWLVYLLVRSHSHSDAGALAIAGLIPAGLTLLKITQRRRVDWIGIATIVALGLTAAISVLFGGSALPLKLRGSALSATVGLAMLVSVMVHRPLPLVLMRHRAVHEPRQLDALNERLGDPARQRTVIVGTVLLGLLFLVCATVHVILALALPTATFLALSGLVDCLTLAVGGIGIVIFLRRHRALNGTYGSDSAST